MPASNVALLPILFASKWILARMCYLFFMIIMLMLSCYIHHHFDFTVTYILLRWESSVFASYSMIMRPKEG